MKLAIVQARMGSTRLPGKVLQKIGDKTILGHLLDRLAPSTTVDQFIVATTENNEDDAIEKWCEENNVACYRGSDWDVLDRFWKAANTFSETPETIVRICCDNPLHSYKVLDFVVNEFEAAGTAYFSNSNQEPDYLEDGFDVEVFSFKALEEAQEKAKLMSEREHVCPYIKKHFSCAWKKADPNYMFKLSVDTPADMNTVARIFEELKDQPDFGIHEVTALLKAKPEILELNKESKINSGFKKSLDEDRIVK
jgi:spore coat polysaccharide biosynthesis protein SpsF